MTIRRLTLTALTATALLSSPVQSAPPELATGLWQVYSDKDGSPDGRVRTFVQDGKLFGVIAELRPGAPGDARCMRCSGAQKDKPIKGLVIISGLEKHGDKWSGGTILEPQSGSTYRCSVKFVQPSSLQVRGYIGISLFGRTQTWKRIP
jgi:uncharacterized protein (DUF2147 family)